MNVLLAGGSGLIGSRLAELLQSEGHTVALLSRSSKHDVRTFLWNPSEGEIDLEAISWSDAIINLAGDNIASGYWTESKKQQIRNSRIDCTRLLAESIQGEANPPSVVINASAIGYYGDRGSEVLTESSGAGEGFLASVCRDWEEAARGIASANTRLVIARIGIVLSTDGGALSTMLLPFRLGLGGRLGDGEQYFPWIAIDDVVRALAHCLTDESISGAVNLVSPNPISNAQFTKALGSVLQRPTFFAVPALILKTLLGDMAREMLLASFNIQPQVLNDAHFDFRYPKLKDALQAILKR